MTAEAFGTLFEQAHAWFERSHAAGWLDDGDLKRMSAVERATPADLFVDQQMRPLVVALFGGTGVGKSSLLNRLAGQEIARTGVERPTSREVTIYVHESVTLADLPPELPLENVRIERHAADARRDVLWIDAPDIDSTEEANRRCALAWLPHVDLLVYVVSPERYRDDAGWRVLLERGHKHGWMFVMNRWDEGDPGQREDFAGMLRTAGFDEPLLLRTCCATAPLQTAAADEFEQIEATIGDLLQAHAVQELTRLGHRARLLELRNAVTQAARRLGDGQRWNGVNDAWRVAWDEARAAILEGGQWPMQIVAERLATRETGMLGRVRKGVALVRGVKPDAEASRTPAAKAEPTSAESGGESGDIGFLLESLWDDWTQAKLEGCFDTVELRLRRSDIAVEPLRKKLAEIGESAKREVLDEVQDRIRQALARAGGPLRRILRRMTGFLTAALPCAALAWVAYKTVVEYFRASAGQGAYLGSDFALHSAILVLLAWAVPFTTDRLLRPSLEQAVLRAMRDAYRSGLDALGRRIEERMETAMREAAQRQEQAAALENEISAIAIRPVRAHDGPLSRVIAETSATASAAPAR